MGEQVPRKKQKIEKCDIDPVLKRQAEIEMGRVLQDEGEGQHKHSGFEIGRYDYDIVNRMAEGVSGYLVRCDMNRERSSIKEFATMLQQIGVTNGSDDQPKSRFNIVKLDARGVFMLALKNAGGHDKRSADLFEVVNNVKRLYHGIESGLVKAPRFCHRVVPVIATCKFEEIGIRERSRDLVDVTLRCVEGFHSSSKFAVAYSSRKSKKHENGPGREKVIAALAQGFSEEYEKYMVDNEMQKKATVDLLFPSAVLNLEQLNVMGRQYAALGVTPSSLCSTKPKLMIKSLQKTYLSNNDKNIE